MPKVMQYASLASGLLAAVFLADPWGTTAADGTRGPNLGGSASAPAPQPLEEASIYLEFNMTANDVGVHIDTDHGVGLRELVVVGPNGGIVREGKWFDTLGLTEMRTESAEPTPERTLRAWPAGIYRFIGRTVDGALLQSAVTLSHDRLPAPTITTPVNHATSVPTSGVTAAWTPVPRAVGYFLEFDAPAGQVETFLPPTRTSFPIPAGLLAPEAVFKMGVAAIHENGNLSLSEIEFETGK